MGADAQQLGGLESSAVLDAGGVTRPRNRLADAPKTQDRESSKRGTAEHRRVRKSTKRDPELTSLTAVAAQIDRASQRQPVLL